MHGSGEDRPRPGWRPLPPDRPWYRKLAAQKLTQTDVRAPNGNIYLVRIERNAPVVGLSGAVGAGAPITAAAALIKANAGAPGETGWTITVLKPSTPWRSERVLYRQPVGAKAIVIDIALAITDALERGDVLWAEDG